MTDDDRDQLLSDILDGVASNDDLALLEADADLAHGLEAMRAARMMLQIPATPPRIQIRDAMIAAALDQLDTAPAAPPPADMAAHRAGRQRRLNLVGAAAAAVLVIGAGAVALRSGSSTSDGDSNAASDGSDSTEALASPNDVSADSPSEDADDAFVAGELSQDASRELSASAQQTPGEAESRPAAAVPGRLLPVELEPCLTEVDLFLEPDSQVTVLEYTETQTVIEVTTRGGELSTIKVDLLGCTVTQLTGAPDRFTP